MKEIIAISRSVIGGEEQQTVNARDLWKALETETKFADWIKRRIKEYAFSESEDYAVLKNEKGENGQFKPIEYVISLDMAKELAMVEKNAQGRKIRQYFIEIEKEYRKEFRKGSSDAALLLETVRRQERELFSAEQELKEWRKLAPNCDPGEISEITGEPRIYLRRVSATSKKTGNSFHRFHAALEAANQILPGFSEALAEGRIRGTSIPAIAYDGE